MMTLTVHQALIGERETREHELYLYKDQKVMFYVGRSFYPLERLREHLGLGIFDCERSPLGTCILEHLPQSLFWEMDLWTVADCEILVQQYRPEYHKWFRSQLQRCLTREASEVAEEALIEKYRPCLNIVGNHRKTTLPEQYRSKSGVSEKMLLLQTILHEDVY